MLVRAVPNSVAELEFVLMHLKSANNFDCKFLNMSPRDGALDLARSFDENFNIVGRPFDEICSKYGSY